MGPKDFSVLFFCKIKSVKIVEKNFLLTEGIHNQWGRIEFIRQCTSNPNESTSLSLFTLSIHFIHMHVVRSIHSCSRSTVAIIFSIT